MNKVVTICGSMKFKEKMMEVTKVIEYAKKLGIPWGISEAAFNFRDYIYFFNIYNIFYNIS